MAKLTKNPNIDHGDIQGLILRGFRHHTVHYMMLEIKDVSEAKALLAELLLPGKVGMSITTGAIWKEKPAVTLNVGITYAGLEKLGVPQETLDDFAETKPAFTQGAVNRASFVGDVEESAPEKWYGGVDVWKRVHVVAILYSEDKKHGDYIKDKTPKIATVRRSLEEKMEAGFNVLHDLVGHTMKDGRVHFGFRDGLSNPSVEGFPILKFPSKPIQPAGGVLLGYQSQYPQFTYPVPQPAELSRNGSFNVIRVLEQDAGAFHNFINQKTENGDPERFAAEICGRWRDGAPLALYPDGPIPFDEIPPEQINGFDYEPSEYYPKAKNDKEGNKCPIGSHMRRANPRSDTISGGEGAGHLRRIVRRGVPYGPPFDPNNPDDGQLRGLLGSFIGVSIQDQFEFLNNQWIQKGSFNGRLDFDERDIFLGNNRMNSSVFTTSDKQKVTGFTQFIKTRGSVYTFMPSLTGLRYLSQLP